MLVQIEKREVGEALTASQLRAGCDESPSLASFANGCEVDSWCFDRPRRIGEHTSSVVMDTFGAFHFVRPAVAAELPG